MLADRNASAIVAVSDIERARTFYRDILGLTLEGEVMGDALIFRAGQTQFTVYSSPFAGTNKANAMTFAMQGDLVETVQALAAKGVVFEHYDIPGMVLNGDVHESGPTRLAWLADPDGNLIHLVEGMPVQK
ncbi:MAG: VOC family protein [Brevundimonas sp.]|uniref:VOC family protein n=1 Tax=Brevundimonas sp. TaxID=1871086 RepID=UPI0028D44C3F|nr:VOC family protein [uncultured Brevundimonas sp.]